MGFWTKKWLWVYPGIFVSMIFWSMSFLWYKDAYVFFGPMATVFLRLAISAIILLSISYFTGKLKIKKADYKLFLVAAFFEPFLYFMGESFGMQRVSPVTAAVIVSTVPVFTPIVASIFHAEKLTWLNIVGIAISFAGVLLVVFSNGMKLEASLSGVLLMFVAVIAAVGYALALKKLTPNYEPVTIVAIQNLIGTILFLPLLIAFDWDSTVANMSMEALVPIFYLAILASSVAFVLYANAVSIIGVTKTNTFTNLIPVMTTIFAYIFRDELLTNTKTLGIAIVVGGLFLSQLNFGIYQKFIGIFQIQRKTK